MLYTLLSHNPNFQGKSKLEETALDLLFYLQSEGALREQR